MVLNPIRRPQQAAARHILEKAHDFAEEGAQLIWIAADKQQFRQRISCVRLKEIREDATAQWHDLLLPIHFEAKLSGFLDGIGDTVTASADETLSLHVAEKSNTEGSRWMDADISVDQHRQPSPVDDPHGGSDRSPAGSLMSRPSRAMSAAP